MASDEFSASHERITLLPLDQDYVEDDGEDEGEDDGTYVPDPSRPLSPTAKALIDGMDEMMKRLAVERAQGT